MKRAVLILGLAGVLLVLNSVSYGQTDQKSLKMFDDLKKVIISVSNSIKPAVVHIEVVHKQDDIKYKSLASGLIVDDKGYILTNEHVVDRATAVTVTLPNKLEYMAEIVGVDKQTDLALLKIEPPDNLATARLGNSDEVQVGEWVVAVGNPYGFDRTVSFGIVSGKGRVIPNIPTEVPLINDFIQTDAAIDPGSSGGPLVNLKGEAIGINSMGMGRAQGFTIPINMAKKVMLNLIKSGTIERGWAGIVLQPLNRNFARYFGQSSLQGILVSDVQENSPAWGAGLKAGDVILKFDGSTVTAEKEEDLNQFAQQIAATDIGSKVSLEIRRGNDNLELTLEVGTQPKVKSDEFETPYGFTVEEITDNLFRRRRLDDKEGVYVSYVDVAGPAGKAELERGDVVRRVEESSVGDLEEFKQALDKVKGKKQIMLQVLRGKLGRFILLETDTEKQAKLNGN
ncbi:MAG: trypsin-like peptidase domain-containing protein [candidate division Zixibacteria bacterium]|nr:trypsin-like peptidase domain-containing protein [candidate division Zixibacteria bacterium]